MEGSAPGPANTSIDPTKIQNGNGPGPMADVPAGGADDVASGATTSSAVNQPPPVQMHPVEASLMAEMQDTKKMVERALKSNRTMALALFVIGLACIYYLTGRLKLKMPDTPKPPTTVGVV